MGIRAHDTPQDVHPVCCGLMLLLPLNKPPKVDPPFFDRLKEAVYQWVTELTTHSRTFILLYRGLMLLLMLNKPPKVDPPFFDRLKKAVYQWASELTTHSRTFILVCSGLMLLLLLSGICLLTRLSTTNYSRKRNDSYDLSEMGNTL
ncbi:hypothetical protein J6590_032459 [Homalodisca vitripennis]|nr:hypothetical protein J6590_032459 [Homalodisca vitripennis]